MRLLTTCLILLGGTAGAQASSFLLLGNDAPGVTSIVTLGNTSVASVSMVTLGEPAQVQQATVEPAATDPMHTAAHFRDMPTVIRAGIQGDAFARSTPASPAAASETLPAADPTASETADANPQDMPASGETPAEPAAQVE